jgi:hypothetical protein
MSQKFQRRAFSTRRAISSSMPSLTKPNGGGQRAPNSTTADDDQLPRCRHSELARLDDEQHASIASAYQAAELSLNLGDGRGQAAAA